MSEKDKNKNEIQLQPIDPVAIKALSKKENDLSKQESSEPGVLEMLLKSLKNYETAQRMSFDVDPTLQTSSYGALYRPKINLVPDYIIKRITGPQGDDLVCQILQARSNIMASFGRPRTSRFAVGFEFVEIDSNIKEDTLKHAEMKERVKLIKEFLWNCGIKDALDGHEYFKPTLSQFMKMITRDGLAHGRIAVERIYAPDPNTGKKKLVAFRPVDSGTIYHIIPRRSLDQSTRDNAIRILSQLKNEKIDIKRYEQDEYRWVQVINGKPEQTFSEEELVVYNIFPTNNVEFNGYPLTPIDQALNAIATHINISLHNKLYFQHGRASKGMLILSSQDVDESTVQRIRNQFHQSINSVQNSWRMPVFGIGPEDSLTWQAIDVSGRDAEFTYLSDNNARVILSAFLMSPEELPGYGHLSRGTNTQALSESNNEWKLTAARDVGLRPLIYDLQDFFNSHIIPEIDYEFSKHYKLVFAGLEQDSPEKEATRISQDMSIHMTYNEVLERVEKDKLPSELGGKFPLSPQFVSTVLDPYLTVGEKLENFFERKGAASDPRFDWYRDPLWLQWQQLLIQKTQLAMQNIMMSQQVEQQNLSMMMPQQMEGSPEQEQSEAGDSETRKSEILEQNKKAIYDWQAQNFQLLSKSIQNNHDGLSKMIIKKHKEAVEKHLEEWAKETKEVAKKIKDSFNEEE
jgi:hypothetical protein